MRKLKKRNKLGFRIRESEYKSIKFALPRKSKPTINLVEMLTNNDRIMIFKLLRIKMNVIYKN